MSNNPTRYIKSIAHQPVDPGIHGQIVDSMSNTTDKRTNAPSIRMAMSNGLPAGAIVEYTGNEVPDGYRRRDDIPTLSELNDNLSGFKFYPSGIQGLLLYDATNSKFWQTSNGEYVLTGTPTAYQVLADNPSITFDGATNTEDLRGKVGADTVVPFRKKSYVYFNGTISTDNNALAYINLGFRATKIWCTVTGGTSSNNIIFWYDKNLGEKMYRLTGNNTTVYDFILPQTSNYTGIHDIDNQGFTFIGDASTTYTNVMIYAEP